jgi:hypothetical protein
MPHPLSLKHPHNGCCTCHALRPGGRLLFFRRRTLRFAAVHGSLSGRRPRFGGMVA